MKIYLVTYDLLKPGKDYNKLYSAIKSYSGYYLHILESTWLIAIPDGTYINADNITNTLRQNMDNSDRLMVTLITPNDTQGWLGKNVWDWLNDFKNR